MIDENAGIELAKAIKEASKSLSELTANPPREALISAVVVLLLTLERACGLDLQALLTAARSALPAVDKEKP